MSPRRSFLMGGFESSAPIRGDGVRIDTIRRTVVSETGSAGACGPAWLRHVGAELRELLRGGVPVLGLCLYPVADYPRWDDGRHCRCGLAEAA